MSTKNISEISFRSATKDDISELVRLDSLCFPKSLAYGAHVFKDIIDWRGSFHIVAEHKGKIVGFVAAIPDGIFAHFITLDVHPDYRRMGLGNLLMEKVEQMAKSKNLKLAVLEVETDNEAAINLYIARGYEISGRLKNYYANKKDAYVMSKLLN